MKQRKTNKPSQDAVKAIENYLTERYGEIKPTWQMTISIIADNLDMISDCKASIQTNGLYNAQTGRKNPLIATVKDLQAVNLKCYQQLGLTPWSESKIKSDTSDSETEALKELMMV